MDLIRAPFLKTTQQMLDDLEPITVKVLAKRKTAEPDTTSQPAAPPEKKSDDRGWSNFTDSETKHLVAIMQPLLASSPRSGISAKLASTHFVLHLSNLEKAIALPVLEEALRQLNANYEVRGATVDFERQFIDIRFRVPVAHTRTANLTNVISVAKRELTHAARRQIPKDTQRDAADWLLVSTLMTHAENVLGDRTPYDLDIAIDTPNGQQLTYTGTTDTQQPRSNYRMRITGYAQLDLCHLRSFGYLLPFHAHPPTIDFETHSLLIEFEKHASPICGQIVQVYDDETALFSSARLSAATAF